jgi:hypothetical protein
MLSSVLPSLRRTACISSSVGYISLCQRHETFIQSSRQLTDRKVVFTGIAVNSHIALPAAAILVHPRSAYTASLAGGLLYKSIYASRPKYILNASIHDSISVNQM